MGSSTNFSAACTTRSVTVGMPSRRSLPLGLGIITCRTATGWNTRAFSWARMSCRNTSTPIRDSIQATLARSIPGVCAPLFWATRSHATTKNAGSQTRLNRSSNRRPESLAAQWCNLVCIRRTARKAPASLGHSAAPVFTGASSTMAVPPCQTRCRPSPGGQLSWPRSTTTAPPPSRPSAGNAPIPTRGEWSRTVPVFTVVRSTGEASGFTPAVSSWLRRRPSPRPAGPSTSHRPDSSPPPAAAWHADRAGTYAPHSSPYPPGFELVDDEEALQHRFLTYAFPSCSPGPAHPVVLNRPDFVAAAPTLPGVPRLRLPPASPHRYDGKATKVSHPHPKQQRLTAHG